MHRSIPILVTTAAAVVPAGLIWTATHPTQASTTAAQPKPTPTHVAHPRPVAHPTATPRPAATYKYTGPSVDMDWGPVQVTIIVKGKRITDVQATAPTERERSAFINQQAIPLLRQEVLQAQSAKIDALSGATMTSDAFYQSLLGALQTAHTAHTL